MLTVIASFVRSMLSLNECLWLTICYVLCVPSQAVIAVASGWHVSFVSAKQILQLHQCGFAEHLLGRIDFIWAGLVLHVLSREDCQQFLSNACSLLKPGGSFYGTCAGQKEAGESIATPDGKARRFLHSKVTL